MCIRDSFITESHDVADIEQKHNDDGRRDSRKGNVPELPPFACTVNLGGFIQLFVNSGECRQVNDGAPPDLLPDLRYYIDGSVTVSYTHLDVYKRQEDHSVAEIAKMVGMRDSGSLIRIFKRKTGLTPGQMKARFQKEKAGAEEAGGQG